MLRNYLKVAWRGFRRRKFFAFISLFGISFTLVVLTLFVSMLDHALGPLEPEVHRDRTLVMDQVLLLGPNKYYNTTAGYQLLDRYMRDLPGVERLSILSDSPQGVAAFVGGGKVKLQIRKTDASFWKIMGFQFLEGGPFTEEDDAEGRMVAVVSESTGRRFFGETALIGERIRVDGQAFQIVGVVKDVPFFRVLPFADLWVPHGTSKTRDYRTKLAGGFTGLFLTKPDANVSLIQQEARDRLSRIELPDPGLERIEAELQTPVASIASRLGVDTAGLYGAIILCMVLFMVLPAVNLVNVNLSRIMERRAEVGVRKAFGAGPGDLVGQFVFENLLLSFLGGAAGFAISVLLLEAFENSGIIPYATFQVSWRVYLSALGLTAIFGLLSGAYPAWRISRLHPVTALRGGVR